MKQKGSQMPWDFIIFFCSNISVLPTQNFILKKAMTDDDSVCPCARNIQINEETFKQTSSIVWRCWQKLQQMYKSCQMTRVSINQSVRAEGWLFALVLCSTQTLRSHFLTSMGQVSKLVLTISIQHSAWTITHPWTYTGQKAANMLWANKGKFSSFYGYFFPLIHCSHVKLYDSLHQFWTSCYCMHTYVILFISISCYTLE